MDEDYTIYQNQADSFYSLTFEIDINLMNILRSFQHQDHEFKEGYLESIYTLLYYYQGKYEAEMFNQYLSNIGGYSIEALIFSIHYYFASLESLEPLLTALEQDPRSVIALAKSEVNKTNILNVHAIIDRRGLIDHEMLIQSSKVLKPNYLPKFKVCLTTNSDGCNLNKETNTLTIDYFKIQLSIKAKGKLDPYVVSHIANLINKGYGIELTHVLLLWCPNKRQATQNYDDKFQSISNGMRDFKFNKEKFQTFRNKMNTFMEDEDHQTEITKLLNDIDQEVGKSVIARDSRSNHYLEKLLIGSLGHSHQVIRDQAVVLLNVLYDGVDWQRRTPYKPRVAKVGQKFVIEYLFEVEDSVNLNSVVLLLKSFIFDQQCKQNVISWHKPKFTEHRVEGQISGKKYLVFHMDFGTFKRCGFYDWKLIILSQSGKLNSVKKIMNLNHSSSTTSIDLKQLDKLQESKPIQGRIIVQPSYTKDLQIHEIYIDLLDAKPDQHGKFTKRGNFKKVKEKLPDLLDTGINCIYLMGALERDNGSNLDYQTQQKQFQRPSVSPLAITCRRTMNTMLGGKQGFLDLMQKAKELNIKVLLDSVTRVSSARPHKRYRSHLINQLDKDDKLITLFGTDGRSLNFEDTTVLNYRKQKVWELYLEELRQLREDYGINGIHLDNCQAWPQIFALNLNEMHRQEIDGEPAYTQKQIFEGHVVLHSENSGYWGSSVKDTYPNPFLIRLCRRMWEKYPDFLVVGEAWGAMGGQEEREISLVRSGIVPRLFKLPIAIASILGENLRKDGTVQPMERQNVNTIKKWFESTRKEYPVGSILIQSTTYHPWPYPALIFKRGTWAAIDLFFTLNDIPMTFMGEQDGHAYREKTTTIFSYASDASKDIKLHDPTRKSKLRENKHKMSDSFVMSQSTDELGFGYNTHEGQDSQQMSSNTSVNSGSGLKTNIFIPQLLRVQSGKSMSQMDMSQIEVAQESFRKQVGPQFGFDLRLIGKHYSHLRSMRHKYKVLRKGKMISLSAEHLHGWHTHVLAFARYTKKQIALVAINFNDGEVNLFMNLRNLKYQLPDYENSDVVVKLSDWNKADNEPQDEALRYFFIGELINGRLEVTLKNFQSQIWGLDIYCKDKDAQMKAHKGSLLRLQMKINSIVPKLIYSNDIASRIIQLATKSKNLQTFINGYLHFYQNVLVPNNIDINKLLSQMKRFQNDKTLLCKLFAFINSTIDLQKTFPDIETKLPFYSSLQEVIAQNKLGCICLLCPELGKWTTTGGLGVMVDELTQELAKMNEDIMVISPYYERNKRGETGYLEKDGFKYLKNVGIWVQGQKYILGIHHGLVNGVNLYWLHNPDLFPTAYAGEDPKYIMKQLTGFAKGSLEMLCEVNIIPSVVVTNDWFCGLVPAYMKDPRFFGQTFAQTKSFHIVHNLDPLYEGRIYPKPTEGTLDYIHELPNEMLIDPFWTTRVVNPSRCALLNCDNWGTVSQSYKLELLRDSPLAPVLRMHPHPFAFPNGIRRQMRLQLIIDMTKNDHLAAKATLQKKYFNCSQLMDEIPVFGFVGRITQQKGVHLILDIVEELINTLKGKVHILVGGPADLKEEYSVDCAYKIQRLRGMYPLNFWADPGEFFYDGTLVNNGCDFGLMPSAFEPGGIVQHEFFIGSTPVIAFKTGGLKDTVHEYDMKHMKGGGFTFEYYSRGDFMYSIQRAITVYKDPAHYKQLRKNAFEAAIDVADVGRAWAQEFYRLFQRNFIDKEYVHDQIKLMDQSFNLEDVKEDSSLFEKNEGRVYTSKDEARKKFDKILSAATLINSRQQVFTYKTDILPQPRQILLSGTFDDWKERHKLKFDHFSKTWNICLKLPPGEYFYKFLVDNDWVCSEDELKDNDIYGNINNFIVVE